MNIGHESRNETVVITGTSRGIGYHLACRFLELGYRVVGISRSETFIEDPRFRQIRADIGDLQQVATIRDQLIGTAINGLINNAGIHGPIGPFERNDFNQWVQTLYVNLFGAAALTQICIPTLRQHRGFVIFLSGGGSGFPRPNFSAYGISKTAVVRFSEVLARELYPEVLVYCVAPGPNRTQLLEEAVRGGEVVPEADIVDFGYVKRLCVFLAENRDPRYSGKFIHVKDSYQSWGEEQLASEAYTLRRIKV
ncbi:MAG: SDR family NAD(P)-dependent oxidoreductase [Candidatus Methylomirabilales bacterium]